MKGVFDAGLLLLHLGLGGCTDVDDGDTACELGKTLLELLTIVIAGGLLNLATDLTDAALDVRALAGSFDDGGVLLVDGDVLGTTEVLKGDVLELNAEILGDAASTCEDSDVLEHGLATISESGSLDGADLECAAELVHHEGGKGLALDVFGDDKQWLTALGNLLEERKQVLEGADFLLVDEDVGAVE